jgi:hypothetical protein
MQAAQRLKPRVQCYGMNFEDVWRLPCVIDGGVALNDKNDRAKPGEERVSSASRPLHSSGCDGE